MKRESIIRQDWRRGDPCGRPMRAGTSPAPTKHDNMNDTINKLPGDLKEVAELIGVENTIALVDRFGGTYIKVPKCDGIIREIRNNKIRDLYDRGKHTIRDLALKYKLTDRTISEILNNPDEDVEDDLLDLFKRQAVSLTPKRFL